MNPKFKIGDRVERIPMINGIRIVDALETKDCKHCGRPMTKDILDKKAKQKSDRIKEARKLAKLLGEPCGAVRKYDREKIIQLRAEGLTCRAIAKAVDCSTFVVSATLKEKNNQND